MPGPAEDMSYAEYDDRLKAERVNRKHLLTLNGQRFDVYPRPVRAETANPFARPQS